MQHNYHQLRLHDALPRRSDYAQACKELASILRRTYARAPKHVQLVMYQDVVTAFRLLSRMDTAQQLSAANVLLQAVEATLPRQRRASAVSKHKQAAVAQHRLAKHQESEKQSDSLQLSTDVLLHIFGFLDARSLAISSAVCRVWNEASSDDMLWRTHFLSLIGGINSEGKSTSVTSSLGGLEHGQNNCGLHGDGQGGWQKAFKLSRQENPSRLLGSNRAFCTGCKTLFWLSEPPTIQENKKSCKHLQHTVKPVTIAQVVTFVLREIDSSSSSSSDSDNDLEFSAARNFSRLWAFPKLGLRYVTE